MNLIQKIIERLKMGYKLADDLYAIGGTRDTVELFYKKTKITIYKERLMRKSSLVFYAGYSKQKIDKQQKGFMSDEEFRNIIEILKKRAEKFGENVTIDWGVSVIGSPTESDIVRIFPHYKKGVYKIEKLPDGAIKVSFLSKSIWWKIIHIIVVICIVWLIVIILIAAFSKKI